MKKMLLILLAVILCLAPTACGKNSAEDDAEAARLAMEAERDSITTAHITYGKQYYAYRVGSYSTTSSYAVSIKVTGKGAAELGTLIYDGVYTEIGDYPEQCWGYRISFEDNAGEQVGSTVYVTIDGRVHRNDVLSSMEDPKPVLQMLADFVKPTNLDAVTSD